MAKRPRPKPVKVTHADGRVEMVKASRFRHKPKSRRSRYEKHLRSKAWKKLRRQVLERDEHRCTICRSETKLEVHHRTYERIFREELDDLTTLCESCHSTLHRWRDIRKAA